jgi:hypothetical protein
MEAQGDFSQGTDDELRAELEGMHLALGASRGRSLDGREERKNADLRVGMEASKAELRNWIIVT